jgi:hypothetical protein
MKISIEIDDDNVISDALDSIVLSHLKNSKQIIKLNKSKHLDDIQQDRRVLNALNVLIAYYGGYDEQ